MVRGGVITGEELAAARRRAKLSPGELSRLACVWPVSIEMMEAGYWPVTPGVYRKLASPLGLPPLADEDPDGPAPTPAALADARAQWARAYRTLQYRQRRGQNTAAAWRDLDYWTAEVRRLEATVAKEGQGQCGA